MTARIVVVDDDPDSAALLCELLERRGYAAVAVGSGDECLEYVQRETVDVVITDIQMPGMTGIEVCRELHARHPKVASIVLTGITDSERAVEALRAGAWGVIRKPVKTDLLEITIQRALANARSDTEERETRG